MQHTSTRLLPIVTVKQSERQVWQVVAHCVRVQPARMATIIYTAVELFWSDCCNCVHLGDEVVSRLEHCSPIFTNARVVLTLVRLLVAWSPVTCGAQVSFSISHLLNSHCGPRASNFIICSPPRWPLTSCSTCGQAPAAAAAALVAAFLTSLDKINPPNARAA